MTPTPNLAAPPRKNTHRVKCGQLHAHVFSECVFASIQCRVSSGTDDRTEKHPLRRL